MKRSQRTGRVKDGLLRLIYPAAPYPHKNHDLLYRGAARSGWEDLAEVILTVDQEDHPAAASACLQWVGQLTPPDLIDYYATVDALLFPSLEESYGLPLVEAMYVGIPVLCADLPYARALCGNNAIYFSPQDASGIRRALVELRSRLANGWWPDWQPQLQALPKDWHEVAARIIRITHHATSRTRST
jgi:glycosyltransferase involved in cell wall biosynthesis